MAPISTSASEVLIETIHLVARGKGPEFTTGEPYRGAGGNVKKKGPPKKTIGIAVGCVLVGLLLLYFAAKLYCSWQRNRKRRPAESETRPRGFFGALFRRKKNKKNGDVDEETEVARKTDEQPRNVPVAQEKYAQHDEDANSQSTLQTANQNEKMRSNSETTLQGQRESLEKAHDKTTENVDLNDTRNPEDTAPDNEPYSMVREAERAMEQGKC
ncbi:hypothetical protein BU24DRAFT_410381 [Aaosphaeria arxii CBS 175.79]|uniref:Uncharacterized protein n=1 Tax=Aaosphaeria arxii CBS 175.79 TaxID=1450172 RepID=A0A6A5XNF3_9PLEO|nr:uncharacterized protein BU24DRAFT_410381 [Aaosphaeria arxii CBS 175.79]KAF2014662.1 hypothetical protein BU24DRAFT_410381 [Aaosphaeria arxii CBS 175.79]